jgi:hypothetical protein
MMLSKEQIEKNKSKLIETSEKYGVLSDDLLEFLGDDLFVCTSIHLIRHVRCISGWFVRTHLYFF